MLQMLKHSKDIHFWNVNNIFLLPSGKFAEKKCHSRNSLENNRALLRKAAFQ